MKQTTCLTLTHITSQSGHVKQKMESNIVPLRRTEIEDSAPFLSAQPIPSSYHNY